MEKDPGPCDDYGAVWYFEFNSRTCRRFLYGGCDGNGNKFDSREDCENRCLHPGPKVVEPEPTRGPVVPLEPVEPTKAVGKSFRNY